MYAVEHGADVACERERGGNPDREAHANRFHCLHHDHSHYSVAAGAECHANPDLVGALLYCVRQHAVDADRSEKQCDAGKHGEQRGGEATHLSVIFHHSVVSANVEDRKSRVQIREPGANSLRDGSWVAISTKDDGGLAQSLSQVVIRRLRHRNVELLAYRVSFVETHVPDMP